MRVHEAVETKRRAKVTIIWTSNFIFPLKDWSKIFGENTRQTWPRKMCPGQAGHFFVFLTQKKEGKRPLSSGGKKEYPRKNAAHSQLFWSIFSNDAFSIHAALTNFLNCTF